MFLFFYFFSFFIFKNLYFLFRNVSNEFLCRKIETVKKEKISKKAWRKLHLQIISPKDHLNEECSWKKRFLAGESANYNNYSTLQNMGPCTNEMLLYVRKREIFPFNKLHYRDLMLTLYEKYVKVYRYENIVAWTIIDTFSYLYEIKFWKKILSVRKVLPTCMK